MDAHAAAYVSAAQGPGGFAPVHDTRGPLGGASQLLEVRSICQLAYYGNFKGYLCPALIISASATSLCSAVYYLSMPWCAEER
jgi:hypothetical protein